MPSERFILKVIINTPLRKTFDYLPHANINKSQLVPGVRLRVPFGRSRDVTGILLQVSDKSELPHAKLKRVIAILDKTPVFPRQHLRFLLWACQYYHHPVGDVVLGTLPRLVRAGAALELSTLDYWQPVNCPKSDIAKLLKNSPKQRAILDYLSKTGKPVSPEDIGGHFKNWRGPLGQLQKKGLVRKIAQNESLAGTSASPPFELNQEQKQAVKTIITCLDGYHAYLLNGITGSGKTEVYIRCIQEVISKDSQVLILLPEIGLTPQFVEHFKARLGIKVDVLHSGLTDRERLNTWLRAKEGRNSIVLGTRSAIWTPFKRLGLIIVDEEHDPSYKQQEGFRYSARDLALIKAHQTRIPVILGTATPSLESAYNVTLGKYHELHLPQRTGNARLPEILIQDIRGETMQDALSPFLLRIIGENIKKNEQTLLFLNRRGYAPVYMCHECGKMVQCPRCDIRMTYHKSDNQLSCHHCGHQRPLPSQCPECGNRTMIEIGHGTQRLTETLEKFFPESRILRIDRDSTRRKGAMHSMLKDIQEGKVDILIGTQMLAKGHHFPGVTLVGIIDADHGLFSADYRASERMGQIIMQVSGRAGREEKPGKVIIQTHFPEHPLLKTLQAHDYSAFNCLLLKEREEAGLPPYSFQAMVRAEANKLEPVRRFLTEARNQFPHKGHPCEVFGPFVPPIEKRAGKYRMQLLIQACNRVQLGKVLQEWILEIERLPASRKIRWSLDVDPQEMI